MGKNEQTAEEQRNIDAARQARAEAVARALAASRESPEQAVGEVRHGRIIEHAREYLSKR